MKNILLVTKDERGVCTLSLNRPLVHNALNDELINALLSELNSLKKDKSIRIVVLTGAENSFCSGADINSMRDIVARDYLANKDDALQLARLLNSLFLLPQVTVARINGSAFGGALGLIACCDIAITSSDARFAFTEVKLGLVPAIISPYIVNAIGSRSSKQFFLSAKIFDGYTAQNIGLIHQVVSARDLDNSVKKEVELLLAGGPVALQRCKALCNEYTNITEQLILDTAELIAKIRVSEEGQEGLNAFLEKRQPNWTVL